MTDYPENKTQEIAMWNDVYERLAKLEKKKEGDDPPCCLTVLQCRHKPSPAPERCEQCGTTSRVHNDQCPVPAWMLQGYKPEREKCVSCDLDRHNPGDRGCTTKPSDAVEAKIEQIVQTIKSQTAGLDLVSPLCELVELVKSSTEKK